MKTAFFILVLIAMASATQVGSSPNTYQEQFGITKECDDLCHGVAAEITDIIYLFVDGFDVYQFLHDIFNMLDEITYIPQVCNPDYWDVILEIVLDTIEDSLQECGQEVVKTVRGTLDFIDLFLHGETPPAIVITRKVLEIANDIVDTVEICTQEYPTAARFSEEQIEECSVAVEAALLPIKQEIVKGYNMNYFNMAAPVLAVKAACYDNLF